MLGRALGTLAGAVADPGTVVAASSVMPLLAVAVLFVESAEDDSWSALSSLDASEEVFKLLVLPRRMVNLKSRASTMAVARFFSYLHPVPFAMNALP